MFSLRKVTLRVQKRRVNLSFQGVSAVSAGSLSGDEMRFCLSEFEEEGVGFFFVRDARRAFARAGCDEGTIQLLFDNPESTIQHVSEIVTNNTP